MRKSNSLSHRINPIISRRSFLAGTVSCLPLSLLGCSTLSSSLAGSPKRNELSLLFVTDVHALHDGSITEALSRTSAQARTLPYDMVLHGGDLISGGFYEPSATSEKRFSVGKAFLQEFNKEVFSAIGNHDHMGDSIAMGGSGKEFFQSQFNVPRPYYSFDTLGYHFIVLDSVLLGAKRGRYEGNVSSEQLDWLTRDLSSVASSTPIILMTHVPLLTVRFQRTHGSTFPAPRNRVVVNAKAVLDLFEEKNLALVLQGHLHVYEEIMWGSTLFVTGGAVCGGWWKGPYLGTEAGICHITLKPQEIRRRYVVV